MGAFLVSFHPLCSSKEGRQAVAKYGLPPFIDGSIRREPDLQNPMPSVSCLCRKDKLLGRVKLGDMLVYWTVKGPYFGEPSHRRLVAILKARSMLPDHEAARRFYEEQGFPVPGNCLHGTEPLPLDMTNCFMDPDLGRKLTLDEWDARYQERARRFPRFLACTPLFRELQDPPVLPDQLLTEVFGRVPGTQNPSAVSEDQVVQMATNLGIDLAT